MSISEKLISLSIGINTETGNLEDNLTEGINRMKNAGGTTDHSKLTNRDLPDQHPIQSITYLQKELDSRLTKTDALTNQQIQNILGW